MSIDKTIHFIAHYIISMYYKHILSTTINTGTALQSFSFYANNGIHPTQTDSVQQNSDAQFMLFNIALVRIGTFIKHHSMVFNWRGHWHVPCYLP